jgi:hypothetical protein
MATAVSKFPIEVGDFLIYTDQLDREAVKHVDCYSGSGFKIPLFSAHAHRSILKPDFIMGGSGGAITTVCRAMGEYGLGIFDALIGQLDDGKTWDGIDGWLTPAYWNFLAWYFMPRVARLLRMRKTNGIFFSEPLQEKIRTYVDPTKFRCCVGLAVVIRGHGFKIIVVGPDSDPELVKNAVISSSLIAFAMDTPEWDLLGYGPVTVSDGGHEGYLPLPTLEMFPSLESTDATLAAQVDKPVPWPHHPDGFIASVLWFLETAIKVPMQRDLDQLHALDAAGIATTGMAPFVDPGGTFDADHDVMTSRVAHGYEMIAKPFLSPKG